MLKNKAVWIFVFLAMIGYTIFSDDGPSPSPSPYPSSSGGSAAQSNSQASVFARNSLDMARAFFETAPRYATRIEALGAWGATEENETFGLATDALRRNYYIVYDGSGSMSEDDCAPNSTKAAVSVDALAAFIDGMPSDVNLGLFVFDRTETSERVALGPGTADQVRAAVEKSQPGGSTPLGRALIAATQALSAQAKTQRGYGEYHIVVITDGVASDEEAMNQMVDYVLANTPITIHTVGFCIEGDHALNRPGRLVYRPAGNPDELRQGLEQVLAETEDFNAQSFE